MRETLFLCMLITMLFACVLLIIFCFYLIIIKLLSVNIDCTSKNEESIIYIFEGERVDLEHQIPSQ